MTTARVSRLDAEALTQSATKAQVSRVDAEVLSQYPAKARLSRLSIEVLVPTRLLVTYTMTGADTFTTTDAAVGDISYAIRTATDDAPAVDGDAAGGVGFYGRSGADTAGATDAVASYATANRSGTETVPVPTDVATFTHQRLFVRFAADVLDIPSDQARILTRPATFAQPAGQQGRLKRVLPNEPRASLTKVNTWSADVPVSRPVPYSAAQPVLVDMGGFGFTTGGLVVNLSEADEEAAFSPYFAPQVTP